MGKLIDAEVLKAELKIESRNLYALEWSAEDIMEMIDKQPEVKVPFKAVAEIKIDDDKLRKICKEQLEAMIKQNPNTLQSEPEDSGWIPMRERRPPVHSTLLKNQFLKISDPVLITYQASKDRTIKIARMARKLYEYGDFEDSWFEETDLLESFKVKAWRPLPEPYKGG